MAVDDQHRPAAQLQRVESLPVEDDLVRDVVVAAVVLESEPQVRPGEVDPSDEATAAIADRVLQDRTREAGLDDEQPERGLPHRLRQTGHLGQSLRQPGDVARPAMAAQERGDVVGRHARGAGEGVELRHRLPEDPATADVERRPCRTGDRPPG